ncbi:TonB-dependent receptor domain-containing protein [Dysgonomonas sp. ZJ709]|uniref:TonB-dependent receptor domain-containing protein n=1 Tax=Dysgonomonas sp. ZJ709 TaxID=2709797 RepID=UPI0013EBDD8B|nr:TonB-dependent receptor [Dysgonomonas sp. ZJ709]
MRIRFLLLLLLAFAATTISGQVKPDANVTIKGQLVDSLTNETIPYATLKIVEKGNPTNVVTALPSDENGNFKFSMTKKGEYLMVIQFIGKTEITKPITIDDQKLLDLGKIQMADDSHVLSEIVVSAQRPLVKVDFDKITYNLEGDPESKTNNVLEMLKKVPMVTVDGEDNIQVKGSSSFIIYMNGKPSNMITSNPKDVLRSMPANTIKDIEVITEPGAKYDAEGVAGIINIITHKQSSLGGYTATLNAGANSQDGFNTGAYLSLKYGKIGFTGNYNIYTYNNPRGAQTSFKNFYYDDAEKYTLENGSGKNKGNGQYGSGEFSFEMDTLNLINVGFSRYGGKNTSLSDLITELQDVNYNSIYKYERDGESRNTYGSTDLNADYQRTFHKKDQLLTFSYRFSTSPVDSKSNNIVDIISGTPPGYAVTNRQFSDAYMREHTFQTDFTAPFGKIHTLEAGVKYIIRLNNSNSGQSNMDDAGNWIQIDSYNDEFRHRNDILAAYSSYSAKIKKWGFKTGLRFEATKLDVEFPIKTEMNFKTEHNDLVPSATVTYQLKPTQNIRFGYNMRISRPGIRQLNPYRNTSNPNFIQYGNPDLDVVKSHSISSNYMFFNPKLNINLNASYNFENNSIETVNRINNGISESTYENIGENKNLRMSVYTNWTPSMKLRINSNIWGGYTDIKANNGSGLANSGFDAGVYGGAQYTLPWTLKAGVNAGYFGARVNLQGKYSAFNFHSLSLMKSFMSDKLTFNLYAQNPFNDSFKFENIIDTREFHFESQNTIYRRQFGIRISFRFGEMKAQIKKTKRGITNDDVMSGGSDQGGGQGSGGQGQ